MQVSAHHKRGFSHEWLTTPGSRPLKCAHHFRTLFQRIATVSRWHQATCGTDRPRFSAKSSRRVRFGDPSQPARQNADPQVSGAGALPLASERKSFAFRRWSPTRRCDGIAAGQVARVPGGGSIRRLIFGHDPAHVRPTSPAACVDRVPTVIQSRRSPTRVCRGRGRGRETNSGITAASVRWYGTRPGISRWTSKTREPWTRWNGDRFDVTTTTTIVDKDHCTMETAVPVKEQPMRFISKLARTNK